MSVFHFLTGSQKQGRGGSHGTKVNRGAGHGLEVPCVYRLYRTLADIERLKTAVEEIERRRNEKFHCSTYRAKPVRIIDYCTVRHVHCTVSAFRIKVSVSQGC